MEALPLAIQMVIAPETAPLATTSPATTSPATTPPTATPPTAEDARHLFDDASPATTSDLPAAAPNEQRARQGTIANALGEATPKASATDVVHAPSDSKSPQISTVSSIARPENSPTQERVARSAVDIPASTVAKHELIASVPSTSDTARPVERSTTVTTLPTDIAAEQFTAPNTPATTIGNTPVAHHAVEATNANQLPGVASQLLTILSPLRSSPNGSHTLTVALQPDGLGEVKAQVTSVANQLVIRLTTESSAAETVVRNVLPELRNNLSEFGQQTTVLLNDAGGTFSGNSSAQHHQPAPRMDDYLNNETPSIAISPDAGVRPSRTTLTTGQLDVRI
jgi:flagellar hook-length control protein FliK